LWGNVLTCPHTTRCGLKGIDVINPSCSRLKEGDSTPPMPMYIYLYISYILFRVKSRDYFSDVWRQGRREWYLPPNGVFWVTDSAV
jgi:hypothetical protein